MAGSVDEVDQEFFMVKFVDHGDVSRVDSHQPFLFVRMLPGGHASFQLAGKFSGHFSGSCQEIVGKGSFSMMNMGASADISDLTRILGDPHHLFDHRFGSHR